MAVDFNVSTEGSNCRQAGPDWQHTPQHTHTSADTDTHILAHFTLRGAIMTVLIVSEAGELAMKDNKFQHHRHKLVNWDV